ncbi:MAG: formimidoylglutamate deiminase [Kiritimatiellia bacterium]|jgi:formimidoylglutamate deiminase
MHNVPLVLQPEWAWTPEGVVRWPYVTVDAGKIVGLYRESRHHNVHRLPGRLMLPGLVNAHSHAFQRAFRGHVQWVDHDRDDFWSWRHAMYETANRLPPEGVEAISRLAFLEMIEGGITHVGEFHYLHHQPDGTPYDEPDELALRVISAARSVGLRIALLRVAYGRSAPCKPLRDDQRRFGDADPDAVLLAIQRLRGRDLPGTTIGLAPHSVRAVPPHWWSTLSHFDGVVHCHVAEQPADVRTSIEEYGAPPLVVLAERGLVHKRFSAVHLTHPSAGELDLLRDSGGRIVACPGTEMDRGDGFLPLAAREGVSLCLGSDSHATIDLFEEARSLEMHARGLAGRRNVMSPPGERHGLARVLLQAATVAGSQALGAHSGGLVPGAPADMVTLDLRRPAAAGVPPLEAAALVATADWVDGVWVAGEAQVEAGRHADRDSIVFNALKWLSA